MRRRMVLMTGLFVAVTATAAATALAVGSRSDPLKHSAARTPLAETGGKPAGGCRLGNYSETATLTPPDDSTGDNTPAATVTFTKPCSGPVVGSFTSEVATNDAGEFIHLDMRATCVGTGGFTTHCTVGQQIPGNPGHTFFQNNVQPGAESNAVTMFWKALKRGKWTFEVLPGGNGTAALDFRTFIVEAF
jgi:hypothetical protein